MSKLSKALRMIELLHARGKMKSSELAYELKIDARTVRDYKKPLKMQVFVFKVKQGDMAGTIFRIHPYFQLKLISKGIDRFNVFC